MVGFRLRQSETATMGTFAELCCLRANNDLAPLLALKLAKIPCGFYRLFPKFDPSHPTRKLGPLQRPKFTPTLKDTRVLLRNSKWKAKSSFETGDN